MNWPVFEPLIPSSLWLALAAVVGALLVVYAVRRPAVMSRGRWAWTVGGMALAVLLVLGILLNPTWVERVAPPGGKPVLTVLVDSTASMGTPDAPGGVSRYQAASAAAERAVEVLGKKFDVRVKTFGETVTAADAKALASKEP